MSDAVKEKDTTKAQLLEAACRIFAEKGFKDATLRDICNAAGVNNAAVNYHFADKENLYVEAVKQCCGGRSIRDELPDWPQGTPAATKLADFVNCFLVRLLDDKRSPVHHQLMMREMAQVDPSEATAVLVREHIKPDHELLMSILDELLPETVSLEQRHLVIFSLIGQCIYYRIGRNVASLLITKKAFKSLSVEKLAEHVCQFTLAALGVAPPITSNSRHAN